VGLPGRLAEMSNYSRIGPDHRAAMSMAIGLALLAIWTGFEAWRGDFPEREQQQISPILWIVGGLAAQMLLLKIAGFFDPPVFFLPPRHVPSARGLCGGRSRSASCLPTSSG
jgi:hypothetical protein